MVARSANPFYVEAGEGAGSTLSGFGSILKESRERKRGEAGKAALQEAWKSQDADVIAQVATDYPELGEEVEKLSYIRDTVDERNLQSLFKSSSTLKNIPTIEGREQFLVNQIAEVEGRGGDARQAVERLENLRAGMSIEDQDRNLDHAMNLAVRMGAVQGDSSKRGLASAKTEIYNNGVVVQAIPGGGSNVYNRAGKLVHGEERIKVLDGAYNSGIDFAGAKRRAEKQSEQEVRAETEPEIQKEVAISKVTGKLLGEDIDLLENMEASLPQLRDVTKELLTLVNDATFTTTGKVWNTIAKEAGYSTKGGTARARMESIADNEILPLLKQTFGSAFTEGEGARLRKTLIDPDSTPDAKMASLEAFINSKERQIRTLRKKTGQEEAPQEQAAQEYPEGTVIKNAAGQRMQMTSGEWVNI